MKKRRKGMNRIDNLISPLNHHIVYQNKIDRTIETKIQRIEDGLVTITPLQHYSFGNEW